MKLFVALISIVALMPSASIAQTTVDAVYFGQTHVKKPSDSYFALVGNRETLIKAHVINPATPAAPTVTATLTLNGQSLILPLTGPATLPASIPDGPGVVQHSFSNTFTGYIPAAWAKTGLQVTVKAGSASKSFTNLNIGAPSKVIMTMFDVHYFSQTTGDYPANTFAEVEAKWPVSDLEVRRLRNVVFPELVIPPRPDVGAKAARVKSKAEYTAQTGLAFDGEQAAALDWNAALKRASGRSGRWSLYYMNIYNAFAGGQAGGFAGVGSGTSRGILHHELGHALSLPHWGSSASYPYKGTMHGITAPSTSNQTHAGPTWAFDLRTKAFIPPTVQPNNVGGYPAGTYKVDPMEGGGTGREEPGYLLNHFSDYSVNQMRSYLHSHMVVWNPALGSNGSYASWNQTTGDYTTAVSNNGVQFPTTRDTQVISIMASISGSDPGVTMVYPPIGPYTAGLIRLFDPTIAADRTAAAANFSPGNGSDLCVRVVQGGITKTYMLAASWLTSQDPKSVSSLVTEAINLPASAGAVTKIELLLTPDAQVNGLPANPKVLSTWQPLSPNPASFSSPPVAYGSSAVTMTATQGELAFGFTGAVEYLFTETTGNSGGTSSGWQSSRTYTDIGLQPGTQYSYTVSMRAGTQTTAPSAAATATTAVSSATQTITVNSTQQFSLQSGGGLKSVTGLGSFNAGTADKLVVVISTEHSNNTNAGFVHQVRYNGKVMQEAIQENAGGGNGTVAIFYLDNPGAIGSGTIQVSAENPNGGIGCAYALSNTQTGFGAAVSRTGSTINSLGFTTAGDNSLVIAAMDNAGKPNNSGTPTATSPLIQRSSGSWGSQWGGHASAYRVVASPATITPTFSTLSGSGYLINLAAVEFPAKPALPFVWTQTAGGAQNWTTASNWSNAIAANPVLGSTVDFSTVNITANTTLNLGANRTAMSWKFGDTSGTQTWTVTGNSLILAGASPTIQVNNNTTRIDSVVTGSAGLAKAGAGNLTLTANNTHTGTTTITAGTLQIGNGGTTGSLSAASAIANNAALVFNRSNTILQGTDFAAAITGTGSLTKAGAGTLILTGANTYTGATTITAGALQIGNGSTTGSLATSSTITNNASLVFNRSNALTQGSHFAGSITGTGSLTNAGTGTVTLNSANTYSGLTTVNAGSFKLLNANALGTTVEGTVVNGTDTGSVANSRVELEGGITVNGETLTLNGAGNFLGALSSTSGSNAWAGNITIGSAGTRLGATTGNTLTVSGTIDSGEVESGLIIRTQDLTSSVILSGANTYLGDTTVLIGKLQLGGGNNRLPLTTRLTMGSTDANLGAEIDLNGMSQEVAGLLLTGTASKNSINNSSATLSRLIVNTAVPSSFAGILNGNLSLMKTGADTLTLSGINTYTGSTTVGEGTLAIAANDPSFAGGLIFGSANSSPIVGTLDLSTSSATYAGSALVRTNSLAANTILLGSARTLTLNGGLTLGYDAAGGTGETHSKLTVTGAGSMRIYGTSINISVNQAAINQEYWSKGTLDVGALAAFSANVTNFNIGVGNETQGPGDVFLSNTANTILATTLQVGNTGANNGRGSSTLTLGTGTNLVQANTIYIGRCKGSGPGIVKFASQAAGSPGTVTITNKLGDGRAHIEIANQLTIGTASGAVGILDLRGHVATVSAETVTLGASSAAFNTGSPNGILFFNTGTFNVNALNMAIKTGSATGTVNSTLNVGGGSFVVNTAFTLGSQATAGASVATLNLTGGTFISNPDIIKTGGANSTATINLDGSPASTTLDLTGNAIGTLAQPITLNAKQGTLRNVASINGTGGLTKTTTGTLILSGTNTYTGTTTVSEGTLALGDSNVIPDTPVSIASATLDAATFTDAVGNLAVTGSAVINLGEGATLAFEDSSEIDWTGGTLTITGAFVPGSSIRFGTTSTGLTADQLASISKPEGGALALDSNGFLIDAPVSAYEEWAANNADTTTPIEDLDTDGVSNALEFILGGSALTNDLTKLPTISTPGDDMAFSFQRIQSSIDADTTLTIETSTDLRTWPDSYTVGAETSTSSLGVTVVKGVPVGFDTVTVSIPRASYRRQFIRLNVTIKPQP